MPEQTPGVGGCDWEEGCLGPSAEEVAPATETRIGKRQYGTDSCMDNVQ